MRFQSPLVPARLIRRYKRFLADVRLEETGEVITAHCPNPGAMTGLADEGMRVWLEPSRNPGAKLSHGWRLVELADGHWAGIDTAVPNRVAKEALMAGSVPALAAYTGVRPEVRTGEKSRIDFLLSEPGLPDAWVEVKNVHLSRDGTLAEFPDCVTARGARHLDELAALARTGARAAMLYIVQRTDCDAMALARDIDPGYGAAFDRARDAGVEMLCHGTAISPEGVEFGPALPVER
ncbi:DNA/RNA nuclease SfsA [Roseicyclus sp. F158]|uniref:Sugar fermentation stimulation protein homolog n=1 Tax=Tropicimonas omnivorans TaxID=3075590 RepID=A0ABU3DCA2_9RHOB|nr:DNA/RNA nuclease SfsA [Roseicyclus sp. F158]MDT0681336.1 DNA/RNA nuclease SfsA [Roseicyclus sp. F158]